MTEKVDYYVACPEVGAQGTPHIQFSISFKKQVRFTALCKMFKEPDSDGTIKVRLFKTKGTHKQASDYCKKGQYEWVSGSTTNHEDPLFGLNISPDLIEYGTLPLDQQVAGGKATEDLWALNMSLALAGEWDEMTPKHQVLYRNHYEKYVESKRPKPDHLTWLRGETPNLWIYGPTGTGKSHMARDMYPDLYEKMPDKWWDNYEYEDVVLYDDIGMFESTYMGGHFKTVADRYRFRCHKKFGSMVIRPKIIIVTSNYHPDQLWSDQSVLGPILDRFKLVHRTERYIPARIPENLPPPVMEQADDDGFEALDQAIADLDLQGRATNQVAAINRWVADLQAPERRQPNQFLNPLTPYPMFPVVKDLTAKLNATKAKQVQPFEVTRADDIPRGPRTVYLDSNSDAEEESESEIQILGTPDLEVWEDSEPDESEIGGAYLEVTHNYKRKK